MLVCIAGCGEMQSERRKGNVSTGALPLTLVAFRIVLTAQLSEAYGNVLPRLFPIFIDRVTNFLNNFCIAVGKNRFKDIDFNMLVRSTFELFYQSLDESLPEGVAVEEYANLFLHVLTLNYFALPLCNIDTEVKENFALTLVIDCIPNEVRLDEAHAKNFFLHRSTHELNVNTIH